MPKILVIDDEEMILRLIKNILLQDNHTVITCNNFNNIDENSLKDFDMILLDIMMPGTDGFEVCSRIRNKVDCPIIFITAKSEEESIVYGLGLGADDYIKKPFGAQELKACINAHFRRDKRSHHVMIQCGCIRFDLQERKVICRDKIINLTKGEYDICEFLVRHKGQVFSREQIYEAVFGYDGDSNDNTIVTHIKNIRNKFETSPIETVWGIGYKWAL